MTPWIAVTVTLLGLTLPARAMQDAVEKEPPTLRAETADPTKAIPHINEGAPSEGLWPSPKLLSSLLVRWADGVTNSYDLEDQQRAKIRQNVLDRWQPFLAENQNALKPLINEFLEMRLDIEPPKKEAVQDWAQRMAPVFDKVRTQLLEGSNDFRGELSAMQRIKFEVDMAKLSVGLKFADQMLQDWGTGEFDEDDVWESPDFARSKRRRARRRARRDSIAEMAAKEATSETVDQIGAEVGMWEQYVRDFVSTYQFDGGQRTAASSVLSEMSQRALSHRDSRRSEIQSLERQIENFSGGEEEMAELRRRLVNLYGPIDEMFKELQTRVGAIPTSDQRKLVESEAVEKKATSEDKKTITKNKPAEKKKAEAGEKDNSRD